MLHFLRGHSHVYIRNELECRRFIEAISWMLNSEARWRMLPAQYGHWNSVYRRFARWRDLAIFDDIRQHFANDPDIYHILPASSRVRTRKNIQHNKSG